MILKYSELLNKYKKYKNPKDKINREINNGKYALTKHVVMESDINDGFAECIFCNFNVNLGSGTVIIMPDSLKKLKRL